LGELIGYGVRSVRDFTDALVDAELLHVRRERQADGCERIYYAPGPALAPHRSDQAGRPREAEIAKSRGEQLARRAALRGEATGDAPNG
jgi:hypothetical protein